MRNRLRILLLAVIVIGIMLFWYYDAFDYISIERIGEFKGFISDFGIWGPIVYMIAYIVATVFFLPGVPITLLAGIAFGPIMGTLWVSIASTIGASLAFLVGRYTGRAFIVDKFSGSDIFQKLDEGVRNQGWKMVAVTRLVPLFPFNAQNYVYGLTDIPFRTYVLVSWLCMLPGTIAYVFLAGAIIGGEGDAARTITYIGIGAALLILLSLVSKRLGRKAGMEEDNNA